VRAALTAGAIGMLACAGAWFYLRRA